MLKKLICAIMIGIMSFSLIGCNDEATVKENEKEEQKEKESKSEKKKENKEEKEDVKEFEGEVFVDDDNCKFAITGVEADSIWGIVFKAEIENKTDKNLYFSWDGVSVNGYMCEPFWAENVQSEKKAKSDISFYEEDLAELGINDINDIGEVEFILTVRDADDYMADELIEEVFSFTVNENTKAKPKEIETDFEAVTFADDDNCAFKIVDVTDDESDFYGCIVKAEIENKTDKVLYFSWDDTSVNGYMCDPFWGKTVQPGKKAICEITFSEEELAECDVEEAADIEEMEFTLSVTDEESWTDLFEEVCSLTIEG